MTFISAPNAGIGPTIGGFQEFVTNVLSPPVTFNVSTSQYIAYAYNAAYQAVNKGLSGVPGISGAWTVYAQAVYNLAADYLITFAQDQPSDPVFDDGLQYWAYIRKLYNVLAFVPGVISSTSDEGTSASYLVAKQFENYTISNLQNLKTPYGRTYLGIAGSWGSLWGLS